MKPVILDAKLLNFFLNKEVIGCVEEKPRDRMVCCGGKKELENAIS